MCDVLPPGFSDKLGRRANKETKGCSVGAEKTGFPDMACLWLSVSAEWPSLIRRRITHLLNKRRRPQNKILNVSNLPQLPHIPFGAACFSPLCPSDLIISCQTYKKRDLQYFFFFFLRSIVSVHLQRESPQ